MVYSLPYHEKTSGTTSVARCAETTSHSKTSPMNLKQGHEYMCNKSLSVVTLERRRFKPKDQPVVIA
jgi:hypothetical protein